MAPTKKKGAAKSTAKKTRSMPAKKVVKTRGKRAATTTTKSLNDGDDYESWTVAKLKKECKSRGLGDDGKKAELIARLNGEEEEQDTGPPSKVPKPKKQDTIERATSKLLAQGTGKRKTFSVDKACPLAGHAAVFEDYDCMLNKTDIGHNNNKYYIIQLLEDPNNDDYYVWTRWGRVGNTAGSQQFYFNDLDQAKKAFNKKFKDKSGADWTDRHSYKPVKGKYTMLEMGEEEEERSIVGIDTDSGRLAIYAACKLDNETQMLVRFIFDKDMFNKAMLQLSFDVTKMPLGKISKGQIAKGFETLGQLRDAIAANKRQLYKELTSQFYTQIPHNFGMKVPPVIDTLDVVRSKMDNLLVLGDIEIAQSLQNSDQSMKKAVKEAADTDLPPHPLDVHHNLLQTELELLSPTSKEYKVIEQYVNCARGHQVKNLKNVWKMNRVKEGERFSEHDDLDNRKLLWHGTNVAVVVAICKEGLRIMPHSGGRVGKGLYFASENSKSAGYVGAVDKKGIMFLNEVALGKEHSITMDDSSLTKPPKGFDSIVARGRTEPDPAKSTTLILDGKSVTVPQGHPKVQSQYSSSNFSQSEYLVYSESQVRMRYMLQFEWTY